MNKKRKILTVAAMVVFGVIIFFHYYQIEYRSAYERTEYFVDKTGKYADLFVDNAKQSASAEPPKKRMTADEYRNKHLWSATKGSGERVVLEYPGKGPSLSNVPVIKDVRMPLFVLAVFYAGLFVILGDNKRKEQ
jgi:hypothetical protein